jgi:iron(III) transport system substrate-binding protein
MRNPARCQWQLATLLAFIAILLGLTSCSDGDNNKQEVIVYTSVDQNFSEPVFQAFQKRTGIAVKPVYDIEAAKTTGLVNRLLAEKTHPQADVFWSGEVMQMHRLAKADVLAAYAPPALPQGVKAADDGRWLEFGGRARVLIVNRDKLAGRTAPASINALASPTWQGNKIAVAYPLFGTTATHAAVLDAKWGREKTLQFFARLQSRGVRFVDGNSVVRDLVVSGEAAFGLTDTDDACGAVEKDASVQVVMPDQAEGGDGALVIPNGAALIAGGPNPENAKKLLNYLTGPEALKQLSAAGWFFVSGEKVVADPACGLPSKIRVMPFPETLSDDAFESLRRALKAKIVR